MLLSQLKYFQVVAKHEHISHAAEELHVAQPALSSTISKLEKEFGLPLFDRKGRNIELNEAGSRLLEHVNFLFDELDVLEQDLAQTKEELEHKLVLSVSNCMFFKGWLQQFVIQNPKIRLQQKMLSEGQMLDALLDEEIDLALGEFDTDVPGIIRKTIIEDEYVVLIPHDHPLAKKETIYFEDLKNENIASFPSNNTTKIVDQIFSQKGCVPNVMFEGSIRMQLKILRRNQGLSFTSKQMTYMWYLYDKDTLTEDEKKALLEKQDNLFVVMRTIADLNCKCRLSLCWKEGRELPYMAQKFIEAMVWQYPHYDDDPTYMKNLQEIDRGLS